jgi:hypothetical protein
MQLAYYVYYRVEPRHELAARERARAIIARVESATAVAGRLLCKHSAPHLWMEVYEHVDDGHSFEAALAQAVGAVRFDEMLVAGSTRTLECFQPCA